MHQELSAGAVNARRRGRPRKVASGSAPVYVLVEPAHLAMLEEFRSELALQTRADAIRYALRLLEHHLNTSKDPRAHLLGAACSLPTHLRAFDRELDEGFG